MLISANILRSVCDLPELKCTYLYPRDFKIFCVDKKAWIVQVVDRNKYENCFYTRQWYQINNTWVSNKYKKEGYAKPDNLNQLLDKAEELASKLDTYLRFDF